MLRNKKILFAVMALAISVFLVACGGNDDSASGGNDDSTSNNNEVANAGDPVGVSGSSDEFILAIGGEIPTLDPHGANLTAASQVQTHTLSRLVEQNVDLSLRPGLATSWEQLDDQRWQFNLRNDVYFHNGDHMTASDVAFSLTRAAESAHVTPVLGMIDPSKMEIIDDYTIIIGTTYPFAPFLSHLAHTAASIISENALGDVAPIASNDLIVGTGPYQIIANTSGVELVMERWDDYHGDQPNMRLLTFRIIADAPARTFALESGEVDAILAPPPADIQRLEDRDDVIVPVVAGLGVEYVMLNNYHIPDRRIRQAINYAVNTEEIVAVTTEGTFDVASGFINANVFGHNPNFVGYSHDVARARELMIEAGYSGEPGANDLSLVINANGENQIRMQSAEIIANQLREIGINLTIETPEFNAMMDSIGRREVAMATLGWGTVTGDADYALFPLFHSSAHSPSTNHALLDNAELDELIERARASTDPQERIDLYWEAQEILHYEAPWILLSNSNLRVPSRSNVRGMIIMPHQGHFFGHTYFE